MKKKNLPELKKLIIAGPSVFTKEIIDGLKDYGILIITCENPEQVRVLTDVDGLQKDTIISALAEMMTKTSIPDSVKADFTEEFFKVIKKEQKL